MVAGTPITTLCSTPALTTRISKVQATKKLVITTLPALICFSHSAIVVPKQLTMVCHQSAAFSLVYSMHVIFLRVKCSSLGRRGVSKLAMKEMFRYREFQQSFLRTTAEISLSLMRMTKSDALCCMRVTLRGSWKTNRSSETSRLADTRICACFKLFSC